MKYGPALKALVLRFAAGWLPPGRVPLSQWADEHARLSSEGGRAFKSPRPDQCFQRDAVIFIKWPSASVVNSVAVSILKIQRRADKLAIKRVRIA